jgi:hypothetical protein
MFSNIQVAELSNFCTDILLAFVIWLIIRAINNFNYESKFADAWKAYFQITALAALIGGFGHLFSQFLGNNLKVISWITALLANFFLEKEILAAFKLPNWTVYIITFKLLIFSALTLFYQNFSFTKIGITLGMIGIISPSLYYYFHKSKLKYYLYIMAALLGNGIGGIIHSLKIEWAAWFNSGDIAHIITCICFSFMFLGIRNVGTDTLYE